MSPTCTRPKGVLEYAQKRILIATAGRLPALGTAATTASDRLLAYDRNRQGPHRNLALELPAGFFMVLLLEPLATRSQSSNLLMTFARQDFSESTQSWEALEYPSRAPPVLRVILLARVILSY